ncbi:MAG TPA: glycine zipper family protein [Myxococcota bacterium]|nr:glycine zipper family protein [Myxococcota bacterium]
MAAPPRARAVRPAAVPLALAVAALACASRPVVYMDPGTDSATRARMERDIDDCTALARTHAGEGSVAARDAARSTARGGLFGAITGVVAGAIWGSPGRGAATGAAVGGTSGLLGSLFRRGDEDPVKRRYVERCLTERGHDVLGWR